MGVACGGLGLRRRGGGPPALRHRPGRRSSEPTAFSFAAAGLRWAARAGPICPGAARAGPGGPWAARAGPVCPGAASGGPGGPRGVSLHAPAAASGGRRAGPRNHPSRSALRHVPTAQPEGSAVPAPAAGDQQFRADWSGSRPIHVVAAGGAAEAPAPGAGGAGAAAAERRGISQRHGQPPRLRPVLRHALLLRALRIRPLLGLPWVPLGLGHPRPVLGPVRRH
mmetsp:Transcript_39365/g.122693  ORF Transcript_39365/g.122693 Transcript_39365/m.122693 type:complete len:224 (+) Transcript_39365:1249-1920(+)